MTEYNKILFSGIVTVSIYIVTTITILFLLINLGIYILSAAI